MESYKEAKDASPTVLCDGWLGRKAFLANCDGILALFTFLTSTCSDVTSGLKLLGLFVFMIQLSLWENHGSICFFGDGFCIGCQVCLAILILHTNSLYEISFYTVQSSIWLPMVPRQNMSTGKTGTVPTACATKMPRTAPTLEKGIWELENE